VVTQIQRIDIETILEGFEKLLKPVLIDAVTRQVEMHNALVVFQRSQKLHQPLISKVVIRQG